MVKQRFPEADVLGIDQSPEMIRAAREENPTLSFQVFDVTRDFTALGTDYDLVFLRPACNGCRAMNNCFPA